MKKQFLSLFAVAAIAVSLVGCGKSEDPATPLAVDNSAKTATIVGYLFYQNTTIAPAAPATIPNLAPKAADVKPTILYSNAVYSVGAGVTAINPDTHFTYDPATGKFTVKVPAPASYDAMTVTISFAPFYGTQTQTVAAVPASVAGIYEIPANAVAGTVAGEFGTFSVTKDTFIDAGVVEIEFDDTPGLTIVPTPAS